ncbi:MAG TPA: 4'-phosphopantetheinyl transferase superfamily protein [Coxiellaceae bacterium]|nr:4'-phosphopantetheinyl transferase superfamily protein [Coxiellaceae bacterium]
MNTWVKPPQQLSLVPHTLQLWAVEIESFLSQAEILAECLSEEEMHQAQRFVTTQLGNNYIVAHAFLRKILGAYLGLEASKIKFSTREQGKPCLDPTHHSVSLEFNMSHTKGLALYGVALTPVGVDVELSRYDMQLEEIAERFFTPSEYQILCALPQAERQKAFYRCWTLKEAFIKGLGEGLSYGLDKFEVDFVNDGTNCLKSIKGSSAEVDAWSLQNISYSEDYAAAFALHDQLQSLQLYAVDALDFIR